MKHSTYTSYDELPLMLSVAEVAAVLGISRAGAYELVHGNEFPALKIPYTAATTHTTNKITTVTLTNFPLCPSSQ